MGKNKGHSMRYKQRYRQEQKVRIKRRLKTREGFKWAELQQFTLAGIYSL